MTVEARLKSDIQSSSPKKGASRSDVKESDLPYRIDLKFAEEGMADEGDLTTRAGQFSRSTVQWEPPVPHSPPGKGWGSLGKQHSLYVCVRLGNTYYGLSMYHDIHAVYHDRVDVLATHETRVKHYNCHYRVD